MTRFITRVSSWLLAPVFLLLSVNVTASTLFGPTGTLNIELRGSFSDLPSLTGKAELPFTLVHAGRSVPVEVRPRGKSRRRVCRFPPLRFNFASDIDADSVFAGQDKIKLVTHCRNTNASAQDLQEEYLAYQIFGLLSEFSFKVRMLKINYVDTSGGPSPGIHFGFLIEPASSLAYRTGATKLSLDGVTLSSLNELQLARVFLFQYLIGNTDYSLVMTEGEDECCHNGDLFEHMGERFLVPYDFDLAGIVDAKYAYPHPSLRLPGVTKRRYRGFCSANHKLADVIRQLQQRKTDILGLTASLSTMEPAAQTRAASYLSGYFKRDDKRLMKEFERYCL